MTLVLLFQSSDAATPVDALWPPGGSLELQAPATSLDASDLAGLNEFASAWGGRLAALIRNSAEENAYDDDAAENDLHSRTGEIVRIFSEAVDSEGSRLGNLALLICTTWMETGSVRWVSLRLPEIATYLALSDGWQPMMWHSVNAEPQIHSDSSTALLIEIVLPWSEAGIWRYTPRPASPAT